MKLKFRLSIIVILVIVVDSVSIILLNMSAAMQMTTSQESIENLANAQATMIQARYDGYLRVASTLSGIMGRYEDIEPQMRRLLYNININGVLENEERIIGIFTIWKCNSIDNMDSEYIGIPGNTDSGSYAA
jgi:methyl-accepting chemotaxis protein